MTAETLSRLLDIEYALVAIDTDLMEAHNRVCAADVPGAVAAAADLAVARLRVRRAVRRLDGPLSEAVRRRESEAEPAPF